MIVIDASAMVEGLIGPDPDAQLFDVLAGPVHAPHLLDVEVLSVLRGLEIGRKLRPDIADAAREDYFRFTIDRYEAHPLADRVWELRHRCTAHDACYLALAEALSVPLYTCARKLASGGHRAEIRVLPQPGATDPRLPSDPVRARRRRYPRSGDHQYDHRAGALPALPTGAARHADHRVDPGSDALIQADLS